MTLVLKPWPMMNAGWTMSFAQPAVVPPQDTMPTERLGGDMDDHEQVRLTLGGDGNAYARLVRKYQDRVAGRLWRFTRNRADLEELVQETFVQAYFSLPRFRSDAPLEHWLMTITTRVGYGYWKRRARGPAHLEDRDWTALSDGKMGAQDAGEALADLLACLPPRDRLVLLLLYAEGRSVAETAKLTGWSQTMVKVQAFRARGKLKAVLKKAGITGQEL
ncbi:MAG: RNA polymerase sigma factor [Phycisphaerae bacterium]